jgi:FkbM family methyltransferase
MNSKAVNLKLKIRGTRQFKLIKSKLDSVETSIAGIKLNVHPLDWNFWLTTNEGSWEPETIRIYQENIREGTRYCDIGAWVGPTVLLASGLGADVTCFEPDPNAYERLLHNIRNNPLGPIVPFQIALAGSDGIRKISPITESLGQSSSSILVDVIGKRSAQVLALSWISACNLLKLPQFDFIKIDIEGGEIDLIASMMEYLAINRPTILISTHLPFIEENRKESYIKTIQSLAELYPDCNQPDIKAMMEGFPSYLFNK